MKRIIIYLFACLGVLNIDAQVHVYTLDEALKLARANNLTLQQSRLSTDEAHALQKSIYSRYFPSADFTGTFVEMGKGYGLSSTFKAVTAILFDNENFNYEDYNPSFARRGLYGTFSVLEPVYVGGILTNANKLAKVGADATIAMTKMKEKDVDIEVQTYFWTLVQCYEARKILSVMDSLVARADHDATTALKAGLVTKNDVMEVDIYKSKLKGAKLKIESGIDLSKTYLAHLTNQEHFDSIQWTDISAFKQPTEYLTDHPSALEQRPEAELLDLQVKSYELRKKLTLGSMLPKLGIGGSVNLHKFWSYSDQNVWNDQIETKHWGWGLYAVVNVPISSLWTGKHDLRRSDFQIQKAQLERKEKRRLMSLQMDLKWKNLTRAYQQTVIAHDQMEQSRQNEQQQASAYRNGVITMTSRLQADALYQQSYIDYVEACVKYRVAVTEYLHATAR